MIYIMIAENVQNPLSLDTRAVCALNRLQSYQIMVQAFLAEVSLLASPHSAYEKYENSSVLYVNEALNNSIFI